MCAGLCFTTYTLFHHTFNSPDTHFDKKDRTSQPYERSAQGEAGASWIADIRSKSRWNRPGVDVGAVSVFEGWLKPSKVDGVAKVHGPTPPVASTTA